MKRMLSPFIEMINDETLRTKVYVALDKVPEYFWTAPASSSGKYHPPYDLGIGGTIRHTVMMIRVALDLLRMENENILAPSVNAVIVACIFHDSFKHGIPDSGHTVHEHPLLAADFVYEEFKDYDMVFADIVSGSIRSHMGRWTTSTHSNAILPIPENEFDKLIALADYIASRKYTQYVPEGSL
ncbi:MAG: HD domain-containing protein [Dehalococcoidales bacterium]|nr:HD domain-containing protein [Dehalococcoidales bacterium]